MTGKTKKRRENELAPFCPKFHHAVEVVGRRWTGAIIRSLLAGRRRFSDILGTVPGLSDRLLTQRLRELESEGIVERLVTPTTPVRIEYQLTDKGRALAGVVRSLSEWAEEWEPDVRP